jgi:hypothetical protein
MNESAIPLTKASRTKRVSRVPSESAVPGGGAASEPRARSLSAGEKRMVGWDGIDLEPRADVRGSQPAGVAVVSPHLVWRSSNEAL